MRQTEDCLKAYRDVKNSIDTALERGRAEGLEEGMQKGRTEGEKETKEKMALKLLSLGVPLDTVSEASGLSREEIERLASK